MKQYGDIPAILERTPAEIAACALPQDRGAQRENARAAERRPHGIATQAAAEASGGATRPVDAFQAVLALPPEQYLVALERRGEGYAVITWDDPLYPPSLRHLEDPPLCLFARARCRQEELQSRLKALAQRTLVAVVGTRAPSVYGEEMATLLGRDLTRHGLLVVSGLATGIDAFAQSAAVTAGRAVAPTTVAVLGCGPDVVYPKANRRLRDEIAAGGLLVSEFAWGVPARAWRFPARNRIMAALAAAVVVVEGSERSGSRITANFALELGREVLAVPGEVGRRLSAAPHSLLRDGAGLCEAAEDVLAALSMFSQQVPLAGCSVGSRADATAPALVHSVLGALADGPATPDQLARTCALPAGAINAVLTELEVDGLVRTQDGGRYRLLRT